MAPIASPLRLSPYQTEIDMTQDSAQHHPLPASEKARHDEIPGTIEREREQGDGFDSRGRHPSKGSGAVTGSGSGAGGGGAPEDYDSDPQAGGGKIDKIKGPKGGTDADAPVGGSR
jgi:hypothetical protein